MLLVARPYEEMYLTITRKKADIPIYSFEKHARIEKTNTIYSPHVLILEGILALHDERVLNMLDLKVFAEADADVCLSRRRKTIPRCASPLLTLVLLVLRDLKHRGRDIEGCMKQWFCFVKPNFHKYVEPQRNVADIIVPRGIENKVAIGMISDRVRSILSHKSTQHTLELKRLGQWASTMPLDNDHCIILTQTPQIRGIHTLLLNPLTDREDFIFMFDRLTMLLLSRATALQDYTPKQIITPVNVPYMGLTPVGEITAVVLTRGGCCLEPALQSIIPSCKTGRILIQHSPRTGEPELHYLKLPDTISKSSLVLLLDAQMTSGGAALMAVRVLVDHGVPEERIVFCAVVAGKRGVGRLLSVFPDIRIVLARPFDEIEGDVAAEEGEDRWIERKYLGC